MSKEEIYVPENLTRVHGTNDKLLPLRYSNGVLVIEDGGHFMVIEQADEVNIALNQIVNSETD